ncbi:hypothetical protein BK004_05055 [bacterium CG10_46_32]|nr:MAG: hypothetical protein BK004_05055 [bacterium CG10_46_32]PIR55636.1 MAG: hypothetical protein COU73_05105 [Parcubacteria group bacterium CG10_big_fil_rev_8_21_14_0_10_46_32]
MARPALQGLLFTFVSNEEGKEVLFLPGDLFDLLPAALRLHKKERTWLRDWIGYQGPYQARWILRGEFTGQAILCTQRPDGSEPGAFASEFMKR